MNPFVRHIALLVALLPLAVVAADKKPYLIIAPHTAEECLAALDGMVKEKKLDRWEFGCKDGDHTGYLMTRASSKDEALANVPNNQRATAHAVELNKFTEDQVKSFHKGK